MGTTPKQTFYENQAASIIRKLEARKMEGYYCPDRESAARKMLELIGEGEKSVAYGGSMTLEALSFRDRVAAAGHKLIVRENYKTPEELKECKALQVNADSF